MTTVTSLIEFLLALLGDEELQEDFREDPEGVLARYGLDSACGEDIRDAQPMVADHVAVSATDGQPQFADSDDPVPAISLITKHYEVDKIVDASDTDHYSYYYIDDRDLIITVDDRDSIYIEADGDVTIEDSFNEDNDITVITDSFNQDNDGIDNKGGSIDETVAAGDDLVDSVNSDDDTALTGSENTTVTETNTDESQDTTVDDSFNENTSDDDGVDADVDVIDVGPEPEAPTAVHEAESEWPTEDVDSTETADEAATISS